MKSNVLLLIVVRFLCVIPLCLVISSRAMAMTDGELKDISIASTILTWWFSEQQSPLISHLKQLDSQTSFYAVSTGKDSHTRHTSLIYGRPNVHPIYRASNWSLESHWEWSVEQWHSSKAYVKNPSGSIFRIMPVFRYHLTAVSVKPYLETSIGLTLLSDTTLAGTEKSTHLHFAEYLGVGIQYLNLQFGYRFMHISNGGLVLPNRATDVHSYYLSLKF